MNQKVVKEYKERIESDLLSTCKEVVNDILDKHFLKDENQKKFSNKELIIYLTMKGDCFGLNKEHFLILK